MTKKTVASLLSHTVSYRFWGCSPGYCCCHSSASLHGERGERERVRERPIPMLERPLACSISKRPGISSEHNWSKGFKKKKVILKYLRTHIYQLRCWRDSDVILMTGVKYLNLRSSPFHLERPSMVFTLLYWLATHKSFTWVHVCSFGGNLMYSIT